MPQPTYTQVRQAIADTLRTAIPGLRTTTNPNQVNAPAAIILPVGNGTFANYQTTFDGQVDYHARVIIAVSHSDSQSGESELDTYIGTVEPQSVWVAIRANTTLGGVVESASVIEATGYGLMNFGGIDYLTAHFIVEIAV